jgi:transposase
MILIAATRCAVRVKLRMPPAPDLSVLSSRKMDALIGTLLQRLGDLTERVSALEAENAALRERLDLPPKMPRNSSTPRSQGHKANGEPTNRGNGKGHAGVARLHPNPTRRYYVAAVHCQHCRADVSGMPQMAVQSYDRIELREIKPDMTRVTMRGGICPCCTRRFKAVAPNGLEPGSPFGPSLRAFVLYLRYAQVISLERLARLMSDLLGLQISEGALTCWTPAARRLHGKPV